MPTDLPNEYELVLRLLVAAGLSMIIGAEREYFRKSAGMRTAILVGTGSALFTVVSKYGFMDTVIEGVRNFDGARVAAQIVTGVGFLGAGLIFVRRESVRGLTTAASIWLLAALGMAVGAGLYVLSVGTTLIYLVASIALRPVSDRMPHSRNADRQVKVTYPDGHGVLRQIMEIIGNHNVTVSDMHARGLIDTKDDADQVQLVEFELHGVSWSVDAMLVELNALPGVSANAARHSSVE